MRAVVYGSGKAEAVAVPVWVTVTAVCFPHRAEATCARCGLVVKLDGERQDAERELGRFVVRHRRCVPRTGFARPRVTASAAPSEEWMRAFERGKDGRDG